MTASAIIHPCGNPAIISDIAITYKDGSITNRPGWSATTNFSQPIAYFHARKHYHLTNNTCISISGEQGPIVSLLNELTNSIEKIELSDDFDDEIKRILDRYDDTDAICCFVDPNTLAGRVVLRRKFHDVRNLEFFGPVESIGSGGNTLLASIIQHDEYYHEWIDEDYIERRKKGIIQANSNKKDVTLEELNFYAKRQAALYVSHEFLSSLSARKLLEEFNSGHSSRVANWGGFLEYSVYDPFQRKWTRQNDSLFLFYEIYADKSWAVRKAGLSAFYIPGRRHGQIYVGGRQSRAAVHVVEDISLRSDSQVFPALIEPWKPSYVTVTFLYRGKNGRLVPIEIYSFPDPNHETIIFNWKEEIEFGVDPRWLNDSFLTVLEKLRRIRERRGY